MQNVDNDEVWKGESSTKQSQRGMGRSCDACRRKKKRCDQEQPCSRCVQSKYQCTYGERRWHQADQPVHRERDHSLQSDRDAACVGGDLVHSTPGLPVERQKLPFKRCSLRASPATGLVGMRENAFVSDFFGCVGFLPLANESQIREAMVKIMAPAGSQQEPDCYGEEGHNGTLLGWGTSNNASGADRLPQDPSYATFWGAVAMGALAKGSPFKAVEIYLQLAREALTARHSSSSNAELARASAILTYLYSFMGDMAKFREYGKISEQYLRASIEQGSTDIHAGLPYLIRHCRKVGSPKTGSMDSSWAHQKAPLQLDELATERDLYPFIAESFRAFDRAVYAKARECRSGDLERFYSLGPAHRASDRNDPLPGEVSKAIGAVFATTNSLAFDPLEKAADRPSIRAGIGDLLINGTLVFAKAAKGELLATLEKLDRSIKVYEHYPGLCRCMMGSHMSHMLLSLSAEIGDARARSMYDRLREAFNSCRASHTLPVPPLDEWQGMATICSDYHCRAIGAVVESVHMKAITSVPGNSTQDSAGLAQTASNPRGNTSSGILPTSVVHGEIVDLAQACPGSSRSGSNVTSTCEGNQNPVGVTSCAGAALAPPATRSDPSSPLDTGSENAPIVNRASTKAHSPSSRTAESGGHHKDDAKLKEDGISTADWLEVAHAMSDEVNAAERANH